MKFLVYFSVISLSLLPVGVQAQDTKAATATTPQQVPSTKLEAFLSKRGVIFIRDFNNLGKIEKKKTETIGTQNFTTTEYWVTVTALAVYEPAKEAVKMKGLQCDLTDFRGRGLDTNMSFLDLDEAESLSKALGYLTELSGKWQGQNVGEKEVYFTTKDDFKVGFSQEQEKQAKAFVQSGRIGRTTIRLSSIDELTQLKSLVDSGIEWLKKQ